MEIKVNDQTIVVIPQVVTLADLLSYLELSDARLAMAKNGEVIPRSEYQSAELRPGDRVEIVRAVGGG